MRDLHGTFVQVIATYCQPQIIAHYLSTAVSRPRDSFCLFLVIDRSAVRIQFSGMQFEARRVVQVTSELFGHFMSLKLQFLENKTPK